MEGPAEQLPLAIGEHVLEPVEELTVLGLERLQPLLALLLEVLEGLLELLGRPLPAQQELPQLLAVLPVHRSDGLQPA